MEDLANDMESMSVELPMGPMIWKTFGESPAVSIFSQVVEGLLPLPHERIANEDVKLSNILICERSKQDMRF
jgi:hypothetical protein